MKNIEIKILNPEAIENAERTMLAAARLTQRGHKISGLEDFMALYNRGIDINLIEDLAGLPHVTLQKFGAINVIIIGLSRRALAQITRHQNEVKFMAGSLQYSDYSGSAEFVKPFGVDDDAAARIYAAYAAAFSTYKELIAAGVNHDIAGYVLPEGFRTSLLVSATPYQWKHMINQRSCRRNTAETRYIMLNIWAQLSELSPELFSVCTGPTCMTEKCAEGKMSCGNSCKGMKIEDLIKEIGGGYW